MLGAARQGPASAGVQGREGFLAASRSGAGTCNCRQLAGVCGRQAAKGRRELGELGHAGGSNVLWERGDRKAVKLGQSVPFLLSFLMCCPTCVSIPAALGRLGVKVGCVCFRNSTRKELIKQWLQDSGFDYLPT